MKLEADNLVRYMHKHKMNQGELAAASKISANTLRSMMKDSYELSSIIDMKLKLFLSEEDYNEIVITDLEWKFRREEERQSRLQYIEDERVAQRTKFMILWDKYIKQMHPRIACDSFCDAMMNLAKN